MHNNNSRSARYLLTIIILLIHSCINAQDIEVIRQSTFVPTERDKSFAYLEASIDTPMISYIATIKATGKKKKSDIESLFLKITEKAHQLGANCFKPNNYHFSVNATSNILTLDVYFGGREALSKNYSAHEKNTVYIFGYTQPSDNSFFFKVDDIQKELPAGFYYKKMVYPGIDIKINKGGITGATEWVKWENKPAQFLSLTGFGLGGQPPVFMPRGGIGVRFNTGRINHINPNFGLLLISLLPQGTEKKSH